jgi:hypothetical protein
MLTTDWMREGSRGGVTSYKIFSVISQDPVIPLTEVNLRTAQGRSLEARNYSDLGCPSWFEWAVPCAECSPRMSSSKETETQK